MSVCGGCNSASPYLLASLCPHLGLWSDSYLLAAQDGCGAWKVVMVQGASDALHRARRKKQRGGKRLGMIGGSHGAHLSASSASEGRGWAWAPSALMLSRARGTLRCLSLPMGAHGARLQGWRGPLSFSLFLL
jgi:DNA-binding transcriptional LysR family regulator